MKRRQYVSTTFILCFVIGAGLLRAQVEPAGSTTGTSGTQGAAQPTGTTGTDATADPNQLPADTTDTTGTVTDTSATPSTPQVWRLHIPGVELETEAWLLPLVAFVATLLLGGILHAGLVSHDVRRWPNTGGSWWKLRLPPFILAEAILAETYFLFVRGLDEDVLRVAGPRARLWLYVYGLAVLVLWLLLPRPKVPTRAKVTA